GRIFASSTVTAHTPTNHRTIAFCSNRCPARRSRTGYCKYKRTSSTDATAETITEDFFHSFRAKSKPQKTSIATDQYHRAGAGAGHCEFPEKLKKGVANTLRKRQPK